MPKNYSYSSSLQQKPFPSNENEHKTMTPFYPLNHHNRPLLRPTHSNSQMNHPMAATPNYTNSLPPSFAADPSSMLYASAAANAGNNFLTTSTHANVSMSPPSPSYMQTYSQLQPRKREDWPEQHESSELNNFTNQPPSSFSSEYQNPRNNRNPEYFPSLGGTFSPAAAASPIPFSSQSAAASSSIPFSSQSAAEIDHSTTRSRDVNVLDYENDFYSHSDAREELLALMGPSLNTEVTLSSNDANGVAILSPASKFGLLHQKMQSASHLLCMQMSSPHFHARQVAPLYY